MNLTLPMNWGVQIKNLLTDLLLKAEDNTSKDSEKSEVIEVAEKQKQKDDPILDRPKATRVTVTRQNTTDLYNKYQVDIVFPSNYPSGEYYIKVIIEENGKYFQSSGPIHISDSSATFTCIKEGSISIEGDSCTFKVKTWKAAKIQIDKNITGTFEND